MKMQQEKANALISKGKELRKQNKLEQAIRTYQDAIALVPAFGSLHRVVGDMHFELGQYTEALEAYHQTAGHVPEQEVAWGRIGQCLLTLGEYEKALEALEKAVAFDPEDAEGWYYGAMAHTLRDDSKKGEKYLRRAIKLLPMWKKHARNDPILKRYFEDSELKITSGEKKWWQFWQREKIRDV